MYAFLPTEPFVSLLKISPKYHIFLKTFDTELHKIEVWVTDQNSQPLETEDLALRINFYLELIFL